jgi:hypothetical protein
MKWFGSKEKQADEPGAKAPAEKEAKPQAPSRWRRILKQCLHVAAVALAALGLAWLNQAWGLDRLLNSRWEAVRAVWLPLVFLLVYVLAWLSWWAIRQLGPDRLGGEFPDLDQAWGEARQLLADNGIDLRTTPVFLVIGEPQGGTELLFAASRWAFQVRYAAAGGEPALHVYGNREAVFVACGSASLLTATTRSQGARDVDAQGATGLPSSAPQTSCSRACGNAECAGDPVNPVASIGSTTGTAGQASSGTQAPMSQVMAAAPRAMLVGDELDAGPQRSATAWPTQDPAVSERLAARLDGLCRRIAFDRRPLVPVNGVLVLLPLFATDSPEQARQVVVACRLDLEGIRQSLGVECPRIAILCDLQQLPGFDALVAAFRDGPSQQWVLGRTFPLVPDLEPARWPGMIEQGLRWLSDSLWPSAVYPIMQPGPADWHDGEPVLRANQRCLRLLEEGWRRMRLIPEILVRSLQGDASDRPMFGGFALAATGADGLREQGFVGGALRWLVEAQDHVGWTDEALREDAACRRWTLLGSLGLTALLAVFCVVGFRLVWY